MIVYIAYGFGGSYEYVFEITLGVFSDPLVASREAVTRAKEHNARHEQIDRVQVHRMTVDGDTRQFMTFATNLT